MPFAFAVFVFLQFVVPEQVVDVPFLGGGAFLFEFLRDDHALSIGADGNHAVFGDVGIAKLFHFLLDGVFFGLGIGCCLFGIQGFEFFIGLDGVGKFHGTAGQFGAED